MSELKYQLMLNKDMSWVPCYPKSEADKVIAEKDAKILALDAEVFKEKYHAKLFFDERNYAEDQLRHNKYKRCLAMARICYMKSWSCLQYITPREKYDHWKKWQKRWTELANKFKEAK